MVHSAAMNIGVHVSFGLKVAKGEAGGVGGMGGWGLVDANYDIENG